MRIVKNDTVLIITGDDRGKTGKVLKIFPEKGRVIVEGVNFVKRHTRVTRQGQPGGIVKKEAPVHASNVMVVCPNCSKPAKIGKTTLADGHKVRICRICGEMLEKEK